MVKKVDLEKFLVEVRKERTIGFKGYKLIQSSFQVATKTIKIGKSDPKPCWSKELNTKSTGSPESCVNPRKTGTGEKLRLLEQSIRQLYEDNRPRQNSRQPKG